MKQNFNYTINSIPCYFVLLLCCNLAQAQPAKRLYIAIDDHTDYMWTANEAKYDSAFVHMLDYYLDRIDSTKSNPPDFQVRFSCDGSYWLKVYEKYRSAKQFDRLMEAIRSGHISSPLNMLVNTYGAQPSEAVLRGMYYAGQLERRYNLRFTMAGSMENNTLPLGLSSLWAGSGAKYSWKGIGGYGSQITYANRARRKYQMYKYSGLDSLGLLIKWYQYDEKEKKTVPLGGYAECRPTPRKKSLDPAADIGFVIDKLDAFCDTISRQYARQFIVGGAFGYGWDDLETYIYKPFIQAAMNATNRSRNVRVSNQEDYFIDLEKTYPDLPSQSLSFGNEWDLYSASMNETSARVRRSVEKLRSAEALASIVSLKDPDFYDRLKSSRDKAWDGLGMYWEHNWTADGPVSQSERGAWQIKMQEQISSYSDELQRLAVDALGTQIGKSDNPRFFVFNPLSWSRNDVADIEYAGVTPVKIFDLAKGKEVVSQLIRKGGKQFVRIYAENIPSVGYKLFEIRKGSGTSATATVRTKDGEISNAHYRVKLSPSGVVTGLYDIKGKRQLIKLIDGKYANDLGTSNLIDGKLVLVENSGPVSTTIKAFSNNPISHTVRITLFENSQRIEIEDSIQANFSDVKSWAFSFNLDRPTTRHEELAAILTAKKDTRGGHYASQNSRLDWQTFNHFADMSEKNYGITISNIDCSFFRLGKSTVDSLWDESSQLSALAGGQVDVKWEDKNALGIKGQNGQKQFLYQFALLPHQTGFDAAKSLKFSLEHQNPLVAGMVTGTVEADEKNSFSLLTLDQPDVFLWSVKPSEDGISRGLIARLWNIKGEQVRPVIRLARPITKAWKTSHIETDQVSIEPNQGALPVYLKPFQMNSYRLIIN